MSCEECKYQHKKDSEEPCVKCTHAHTDRFEPMTNADYIRNMDSYELANFLSEHFECPPEGKCPIKDACDGSNCKVHIFNWLLAERKAE